MPPCQNMENDPGQAISPMLLKELSEYIGLRLGLNYPPERWGDLERAARSIALDSGFDDPETSLRRMFSSPLTPRQIEIFSSHLTVGETYFFRETESFDALERAILPEIVNLRRPDKRLRIWSAGCSTGEEAYSIAILLSRVIPDWKEWNILLLATDVNPGSLKKAAAGLYGEWSFRQTPPPVKEKCFLNTDKAHYKVLENIKKMVSFAYLNLAEDTYPSLHNNTNAMDIIFCRNALMYLVPAVVKKCVQRFYDALLPNGWFIGSASEGHYLADTDFTAINFPGTILYRKSETRPHRAASRYELPAVLAPPYFEPFSPEPPVFDATFGQGATGETGADGPAPDGYAEALAKYDAGQYGESIEKIQSTLTENQDNCRSMVLLARAFANGGELTKAEECCRRAIEKDRLNPVCYYLLANILQETGQFDEAFQLLKTVIYLDNEFVLAHFALGNLARQRGGAQESFRHFKNARSLLKTYHPADIIPESEGLTALRLTEMISSIPGAEGAA